jgi:tripartite-type tricarboxylate transporter receptor subunit TctC
MHEVLADPEVRDTLAKSGASIRTSTPQELDRLNRDDYAVLAKLIKDAKIKGD